MVLLLVAPTWSFANEFFTIIGPDGRPMIVQRQSKKTSEQTMMTEQKTHTVVAEVPVVMETPTRQEQIQPSKTEKITQSKTVTPTTVHSQQTTQVKKVSSSVEKVKLEKGQIEKAQLAPVKPIETSSQQKVLEIQPPSTTQKKEVENTPLLSSQTDSQSQKEQTPVTKVDGVEYVNNEYLENREFNLEGKKRFYVMPLYNDVQGGANAKIGHMETVEREKGVNKNFLNQMFKKEQEIEQPLTLATTYYRISKESVEQNLEQRCFTGKKVNKAKILSQKNADVALWPTAPLKDTFEYEIVQVEKGLKDIKLTSYAKSQTKPVFYWPLVVFLDQQGCVIEGVGGFKNQDITSSSLHYAAIEGLIRVPEGTTYLFMTPLASAVDVEDKALINHGQIKLSVLR